MRYILRFNENIQQAQKLWNQNNDLFRNLDFDSIKRSTEYKNYLGPYIKILIIQILVN
jgi:hypothetical protein